jgi:flavoprotein
MDWDNFAASFKHIGDALVSNKVIKDDKPGVVVQFLPEQIKCKRVEQKVVIIIEDY